VRWFQSQLAAYGCDTTYLDTFELASPSDSSINAIGVKRGRVNPNQIYVVCGHVDNTSPVHDILAPGSDDNASGSGLVLEAARMFQRVNFDYTVWFIGFSGEEQGFYGSRAFVGKCFERGDSIVLAINHDMISWTYLTGRDSLRIVGKRSDPPCSTWVECYMAMADTFTDLNCHREIVDDQSTSDHYSFWRCGYAAIRDGYFDKGPMYHTIGDTIGPYRYFECGTNNIPVYTEAIKATVATVARLAGAHAEPPGVAESPPAPVGGVLRVTPSVGRAPVLVRLSSAASRVSVYNAAGRLVRRLGAGQVLTWDGCESSGAAARPGVYYFRAADTSARFVLAR
jgi:aminopeptidase YwaD